MSEQFRILEMIQNGQITAAEGMELMEALKASENVPPVAKPSYKFLRVKVNSDNNTVRVNVNVPIRLLDSIGEVATKMTSVIPEDARKNMESKGIDITSIDFTKIIEALLNGTLEDPNIVDVEAWDEERQTMVTVKIYAD